MAPPPPVEQTHRKTRFVSVIAATIIAIACGTNYAYSAWAPQYAERMQLSATQSNVIGNAGNIGMYAIGIPSGLLIDNKGPRWGVLLGIVLLACGYFPLRSAYLEGPGSYSVSMLSFLLFLTGVGSCSAFSAALKVSATNWPQHRGTATAFPLSAFGLSALFFTTVSGFAFPDSTGDYLLLLAVGTTCLVSVGMIFLKIIRPESHYEAVPGDDRPGISRKDSNQMHRTKSPHSRQSSANADETSSLVSSGPGDIPESRPHAHAHTEDITGFALLKSPKFWQLFIMLGLLCGVGLMTINNIGNNARSLWHHYDDSASRDFIQKRQLMHVSILSFFSFLGRLSSGIGSDFLIHHHCSRFWTLVVSACIFTIAQVLALTIENPNLLFWLSSLTGLGYGALFGVYPALVADAFGPSGMGINWGVMTLAPSVSGNVFNLAYGSILDQHSIFKDDGTGGGERVCDEGRNCYASAYYVTLLSSFVAIAWSLHCIRQGKVERLREGKEAGREHEG
ncbi:hypothetical protein MBLNU230_g5055t1 [Neophaeotheca triangularis]